MKHSPQLPHSNTQLNVHNARSDVSSSTGSTRQLLENPAIYGWLAGLMSVSFSGATFGIAGLALSVMMAILAGLAAGVSLMFGYRYRHQDNVSTTYHRHSIDSKLADINTTLDLNKVSEIIAIFGIGAFVLLAFSTGLVIGLLGMLFFLHLALNVTLREHRQVYFAPLINFVALMAGAVNTFSSGYLIFMLLFCVVLCFYLALVFVDRQRYLSISSLPITSTKKNVEIGHLTAQPTHPYSHHYPANTMAYVGQWRYRDQIWLAVSISALAGILYLLIPQLPAGNLGAMPLDGFGKYDNQNLAEQILPQGTDLGGHFFNPVQIEEKPTSASSNHSNVRHKEDSAQAQHDNRNGNNNDGDNQTDESSKTLQSVFDDATQTDGQPITEKTSSTSGAGSPRFDPNANANMCFQDADTQLDNDIYFYVNTDRPRYLQASTATQFDGRSWHQLQYGWRKLPSDFVEYTLYEQAPNTKVHIQVVKDNRHPNLLTTADTVGVRFPNNWVATNYYDQLKTGEALKAGTSYELLILAESKQGRPIDRLQAEPDEKDLQLPSNLDPRILKLSNSLVTGLSSDAKKAEVIETHLKTQYEYTLDTVPQQNDIPLADFLFGSKRGHCEYYATAMAIMLRQQGVPTRMISGFVAQDRNPVTGYYEVKGTNAHAWVQAYVDGVWQLYEPTGAYDAITNDSDKSVQATHQSLNDYLEQVTTQERRLENIQPLSVWEKIQRGITQFWYALISGFGLMVSLIKSILPWLLGILIIIVGLGWLARRLYQMYGTHWQDKRDLARLKKLRHSHSTLSLQHSIQQHLTLYQAMLSRHHLHRPIGEPIETFTQNLYHMGYLSEPQQRILMQLVNDTFYDEPTSTLSSPTDINTFMVEIYQETLAKIRTTSTKNNSTPQPMAQQIKSVPYK